MDIVGLKDSAKVGFVGLAFTEALQGRFLVTKGAQKGEWKLLRVEWLLGQPTSPFGLLVLGLAGLLSFVVWFFLLAIMVRALVSFVSPDAYHPMMPLLGQLTEPLLRPLRRRMPPLGPFDLSPMVVCLLLILANILLVAPLQDVGRALGRM